jgi:hypothetical protein
MDDTVALVKRASRFPIRVPLQYRAVGERRWSNGSTENISCSGVLFRGEYALELNTAIEMMFVLPVPAPPTAEIKCKGCIVRSVPCSEGDSSILAATILDYGMRPRLSSQEMEESAS